MKHLLLILSAAAVLMVGCKHEDHVIGDIEDRLELLENGSFPKVDAQIDSINSSLIELKKTNDELDSYIEDLEKTAAAVQKQLDEANSAIERLEANFTEDGQEDVLKELNELKSSTENELAAIKATIEELKSKDIELEKAIDDLEVFVSEELAKYATTEWAEATFATLEQYNNIQEQLTAINALVISTQESIVALEERVNEKIETDISAAVEGLEDSIASEVSAITEAYTSAISDARNEIEAAYTEAIAKAISDSEKSIKKWVNEVLAEGYYTISEVDLMIRILEGRIKELEKKISDSGSGEGDDPSEGEGDDPSEGEGDDPSEGGSDISAVEIAHLQKQITALETALANAKIELTEEFEKAIAEAIKNDGKIDQKIADAVKDALSVLQTQIDAINSSIETIQKDVDEISKRLDAVEDNINDILKQIEELNKTIEELNKAIEELKNNNTNVPEFDPEYLEKEIEGLKARIEALEGSEVEASINDINKEIEELKKQIDAIAEIKEQIEKLMNQVQSISYIPRTNDGTIRVSMTTEGTAAAFMDFFVSPASAVTTLNTDELWKTALSVQAVYTETEGAETLQFVTLPIIEYNGNDTDGIVSVKVDASGLDDEFFAARIEASAFLKISDGNTNHVSDYVSMTANSTIWPGNFTVNDWIVAHEIEGDANEN